MSTQGFTSKDLATSPDVQAITQQVKIINETVDLDQLMKMYADDAVRIAPFTPGIYHGAKEIRDAFENSFNNVASRSLTDIDLNVVTNGNMGVAYSQQKITTFEKDGKKQTTSVRSHDVFKKQGGAWVIVLQHTSYLVDLKTRTAAFDQEFIKPGLVHWTSAPFPEEPVDIKLAEEKLYEWQIDDIHAQCAEQAMRFYGPGDYVTVYDSRNPPGRMVGMWDVYTGWLPEMMLKYVDDTLAEYRCFTDGQFAALYTIQDIVASKLDGSTLKSQMRQTDCLHKVDGHWYSYVESVSWPIDQKTGEAVINLPEALKAAAKK